MSLRWEDKEVKFDIPYSEMCLKAGEKVVDKLENVEDTKGNSGEKGRLIVTNIRILWHSLNRPRINLSIGFQCIIAINTKTVNSKLKGTTQALQLLTASAGTRFEFIFTNLVPGNMRHFTSVVGVHKAYNSTKLYRELKLRAGIVHNKQLNLLPSEQIFSSSHGVWNLSSDQGSLGTFVVTNIRVVWFADVNDGFNISLPHLQIEDICIRDSKFGTALVITSTEHSGGFVLGFKVDPEEKLRILFKELSSLHSVYATNPIFGVEYKWRAENNEKTPSNAILEDVGVIEEPKGEIQNTIAAYLADENHEKDRRPVFSTELGLAVETVKEGFTLQKLWEVIPS